MNRSLDRLFRGALPAAVALVICGIWEVRSAASQESLAAQSEALIRWADEGMAEVMRGLPAGTKLPPPSATAVDGALDLFSTSPLTGQGFAEPTGGVGQPTIASTQSRREESVGGSLQSGAMPPITIQLPPTPPESQAPWGQAQTPAARSRPAVGGAPTTPAQPPANLPNPTTIPLPPHPPESQAPWQQGG